MNSFSLKNILLTFLPFITTAVVLTVIQPPISFSFLAWVSLLPFILICSPKAKPLLLVLAAYLVSACYWLANLYWMAPVTLSGWLAFCLYTALLWPLLVFTLRYCRAKKIPLFLAVPVLFVAAERLQGLFLGGFFWRFLAHSQYANITLIQIADIFGAAGISFLIAMVNGLIADLFIAARGKSIFRTTQFLKIALVCAALAATIAYGRWRINQSDKYIEDGPLVASLQSNVPQSVKESFQASDVMLEQLLQKSKAAAGAGAELIVWPETMVQATLDKRVLNRLSPDFHCKTVDEILRDHSNKTAFVLVGAYGGTVELQADLTFLSTQRYNSAFLYRPDGTQAETQYNKIHLVPFGEVVPFKKSSPFLYNLLMKFSPYDYDYSLDAGTEYTIFEMTAPDTNAPPYRFSVMICYEDAIPAIARRFAIETPGRKRIDWLVNISNDGWFVRFKDDSKKVFPSTELPQHAAVCVFRAVENRLAILRSVNTGISCLIDSAGRIRDGFIAASSDFPYKAMDRKGVAGWFLDRVPIDKRTTFFSKYGQWLDFCCLACLFLTIILSLLEGFGRRKIKGLTNEKNACKN